MYFLTGDRGALRVDAITYDPGPGARAASRALSFSSNRGAFDLNLNSALEMHADIESKSASYAPGPGPAGPIGIRSGDGTYLCFLLTNGEDTVPLTFIMGGYGGGGIFL